MSRFLHPAAVTRLRGRFVRLYGEAIADRCLDRLGMLIGRYGVGAQTGGAPTRWDQRTAVLITYGDSLREPDRPPLETLKTFADGRLRDAFSAVHVLPFFPSSSDDGFSVVDYREVRPDLGHWEDVKALGAHFDLMFDLVLNHVSRQSEWFRVWAEGDAPYRDFFLETDPLLDLSQVVRPRSLPLLTPVRRNGQEVHLWTTFSADQIDLNFGQPDVLFEFLDILFGYIAAGARIIRLDAIAFLWKRPGTSCLHLAETHEVVKLMRDIVDVAAPSVWLLTETNVPHQENISYFGAGDEAHLVYQFSLPPLLLHALQTGSGRYLTKWAAALGAPPAGCTYLNFTASHDGIGVRPLQGLLPEEELERVLERVRARGGQVSTRRAGDGPDRPYELNCTYFDALADGADRELDIARFLCSQTLPLCLQGIPAVYLHSLTASGNDQEGFRASGRARSLNRRPWPLVELEGKLDEVGSRERTVFRELTRRLALRRGEALLHPAVPQEILDAGDACFAVARRGDGASLVALHNLTAQPQRVKVDALRGRTSVTDVLAQQELPGTDDIPLAPYQCRWLLLI